VTHDEIRRQQTLLERAGATNISIYIEKLCANCTNHDHFEDLLFEGRTALMLLMKGFSVDMRESPDLSVQLAGDQFYAEVKHFRLKEQDKLDEANMRATEDLLVPYGDTVPSEGEAAWVQVVNVAKSKTKQYRENSPNILVIGSSSPHCIDDVIIPTAINIIAEEMCKGKCVELNRLNGILLISHECNNSRKRNVYFFQTYTATISLPPVIIEALNSILLG
jgi:hypothetical protein